MKKVVSHTKKNKMKEKTLTGPELSGARGLEKEYSVRVWSYIYISKTTLSTPEKNISRFRRIQSSQKCRSVIGKNWKRKLCPFGYSF